MLGDSNVAATIAVKDLAAGRKYYEDVIGLHDTVMDGDYAIVYKSGNSMIQIYPSEFAGTNKATAATWEVDDIQAAVADLKSKGVSFEHYDMPGLEHEGDVHVMETEKAAWWHDPDGNILCVHSSK